MILEISFRAMRFSILSYARRALYTESVWSATSDETQVGRLIARLPPLT